MDSSGKSSLESSATVPGLNYLFIWLAFAAASLFLYLPFTVLRKFLINLSVLSIVLRVPIHMLEVQGKSIKESPSTFRGLVGLWVIVGLILITTYQIHNFVVLGRNDNTAMQPGTSFSGGESVSIAKGNIQMQFTIFQTAATCDGNDFSIQVQFSDSPVTSAIDCSADSINNNITISASLSGLSYTSSSVITLKISSRYGSLVFAQAVSYTLDLSSYNKRRTLLKETISSEAIQGLQISLAAIPTEYQVDGVRSDTNYIYTHSSTKTTPAKPPSTSTMLFQISLPTPEYYFLVNNVQAISTLQFITSLVALASAVITGGTLFANFVTAIRSLVANGKRKQRRGSILSDLGPSEMMEVEQRKSADLASSDKLKKGVVEN